MVETRSKRPLAEVDANVPTPKSAKKNDGSAQKQQIHSAGKQSETDKTSTDKQTSKKLAKSFKSKAADGLVQYSGNEARIKIAGGINLQDDDPYEYVCMARTKADRVRENNLKPVETRDDAEGIRRKHNAGVDEGPGSTDLAKDHPDHKWVLMRNSWDLMYERVGTAKYCCPEAFGMYIWNDWEGYGMLEIVKNFVADFYTAFAMPESETRLKNMWFPLAALLHWDVIKVSPVDFTCGDDAGAVPDIIGLIGRAFMTMLNELERADELSPNSSFKDLALVVSLALIFLDEYQNEDAIGEIDEEDVWTSQIVLYAQKHDIDLINSGVSGIEELVKHITVSPKSVRRDKWPNPGPDRWSFTKAVSTHLIYIVLLTLYQFRTYELKHGDSGISMQPSNGHMGGSKYDITKMPKAQRRKHSFDKKDPFPEFTQKELNNNQLSCC